MSVCYKVCRVQNGKYFSELGHHYPKWDTEYTIGKHVYSPVGKLFVYLDIVEAIRYWDYGGNAILRCVTSGSIEYVESGEFEDFECPAMFPTYWKTRTTKASYPVCRSNIGLVDYLIPKKVFSSEEVEALRRILV